MFHINNMKDFPRNMCKVKMKLFIKYFQHYFAIGFAYV